METKWAVEHLQVIRTLMERSALYRRALAPVMTLNGTLGVIGAISGWLLGVNSPSAFILYWGGICVLASVSSLLLVRRQALKASEPFWSLPTRRVTEALSPPLAAGFIITVAMFFCVRTAPMELGNVAGMLWLPLAWVVLYGCALHAAGFFMRRGTKLFGWACILGGSALFALGIPDGASRAHYAHGIMGFFFGAFHLAYGVYLYFTEEGTNAV